MTESSAARKVVRIQVNGGQQASGRQVRFSGAQGIEASALTAVLRARGLTDYLWIDPNVVVDPLRNHYVAAGYRSVRVAPELPRFDGDTAVLAVAIDEGPVTRLAGVTVEGGVDALQEPVAQASRLPVGEPYRSADVDEARRRIEAEYRRRGYQRRGRHAARGDRRGGAVGDGGLRRDARSRAATLRRRRVRGRTDPAQGSRRRPQPRSGHAGGLRPMGAGPQARLRHQRVPSGGGQARRSGRPGERRRDAAGARPGHGHRVAGMAAALRRAAGRLRPDRSRRHVAGPPQSRLRRRGRRAEPQRPRPRLHLRPLHARRAAAAVEQHVSELPDAVRPRRADQRLRVRRAPGSHPRRRSRPGPASPAPAESRSSSASAAGGGSRPATATGSPTKCSMPSTRRTRSSSTR